MPAPLPELDAQYDEEPADTLLGGGSVAEKLRALHAEMRALPLLSGIDRIAAAVYEPKEGTVKAFVHSNDGPNPLGRYTARLDAHPGLDAVARDGRPLVENDLQAASRMDFKAVPLVRHGYRARCVTAVQWQGTLYGFLFFNSFQPGYFTPAVLEALRPFRRIASLMIAHELSTLRAMLAAVRTARAMSLFRDQETGGHLERMARYAQLIARRLAPVRGLSDAFVEYLFQYAPLHDVGKVAVPDRILLKPGRLTPEEFAVMQTHVVRGLEIVEAMQRDHGLHRLPHADLLRNVIACHHEAVDGSGYPHGLTGEAIPLEGRITTVADVFDALTSERPYKAAWSNAQALDYLRAHAGSKFDPACVEALAARMDAVEAIQASFRDEPQDEPSEEAA
ncbi:HD-GYP domain-containing protein [Azospirillum sp.]|uniref:HD-GYP domain-containing protein n=1 Tax=Azospirillum sp. TaxID=34012 RepID=UPI002D576A33|nr:HD domain-containing phosphohydrolase [Azospirillum sp.]HYD69325.1 HD domain-containing phosphohydrolase [Azospirillum sp.]